MRGVRRVPARYFTLLLLVLMATLFASAGDSSGVSWTVQTSGLDTNLRGVSGAFLAGSDGVAVWASGSNGVILRSVDSGKTWKELHVAGGEALDFRSIQAFDTMTAYVMSSGDGDKSRIYKTTDGGATWRLQYTDKRAGFFLDALVCSGPESCFALSDPVDGKFVLLGTTDGEQWKQFPHDDMPAALPAEGAFAASGTCLSVWGADIYFATGGSAARLFHSHDSGKTWSVVETAIAHGNASSGIFSIGRISDTVVVLGGDYKQPNRSEGTAAYSLDEGKTWKLAAQQPGGYRSALAWIDGSTAAAVGPNGEDVSEDGGVHWQHTDALDLNALVIVGYFEGWAVGPKGTIARMSNTKHYEIRMPCVRIPDGLSWPALGQ